MFGRVATVVPPPAVGPITVELSRIPEHAPACARFPDQVTVSAPVNGTGVGMASAVVSWAVGRSSGSNPMSSGAGAYVGVIGPFPGDSLAGGEAPIAITVTATDRFGATGARTDGSLVTLVDCGP